MRLSDESGSSLVETIATVSIMGVAIVGIVGAIGSAVMSANAEKQITSADGVLLSYGEMVRAAEAYVPCASPSDYSPAAIGWDVPAGFEAEVSSVELWDGSYDPVGFVPAPSGCSELSDPGVQRLVLEVTAPGDGSPRTLEFVWRSR